MKLELEKKRGKLVRHNIWLRSIKLSVIKVTFFISMKYLFVKYMRKTNDLKKDWHEIFDHSCEISIINNCSVFSQQKKFHYKILTICQSVDKKSNNVADFPLFKTYYSS